ncbi:MAG: serine/threonine-protein kinase PknD, partial [Parachlamydiaceae bacterium]|nr:serine/threonine-protein kinase PknD [Parachlamydiaceae bacterium]
RIALKRIRTDLVSHQQMHNRFLKEARVTSQLTHPSIIAIYEIHDERNLAFYTMPYVEGKTLKQMLKSARIKEKQGEKLDHAEGSIPAIIRIFLSVCQAVAYAHSKGVLHRDLKPENIIVGKYGEALILDWGLAKLIDSDREKEPSLPTKNTDNEEFHNLRALTNIGKVVGTISYMAPERAIGNPATLQTDIYSLGVILYQILTLRYPFRRKSLKEFRQNHQKEHLYEPTAIAPHRDVPDILSQIAMKCLSKDPLERYKTVDEILTHLESYIEGRPEWFIAAHLDIHKKADWEFQENVLIAEHTAITRGPEISDWVNLMISKESFDQNTKIEAELYFGANSHGLGFLLSVPEAADRIHLNDGYTLWLGSDLTSTTKLSRSTVEILHAPEAYLQRNVWHRIRIEKVDNHIYYYLNDHLQFSYLELLPIIGTHIGLLSRDGDFKIRDFKVSIGGHNITINCLAVPDAFLAHKDYVTALSEYRRIGNSFPGRAEGREALFRAGITLLEQAKTANSPTQKEQFYEETFTEFEKLHNSAGAPLEYLGKALVYKSLNDYEEEVKCFELALRRYPQHPLLGALKEQIIYRMHENSRYLRRSTYKFMLLVARLMPEATTTAGVKNLFNSLNRHWEPLYFFEDESHQMSDDKLKNLTFSMKLAFWLAKPYVLNEVIDELLHFKPFPFRTAANAVFCLIELGSWQLASKAVDKIISTLETNIEMHDEANSSIQLLQIALLANQKSTLEAIEAARILPPQHFNKQYDRLIIYLMEKALDEYDIEAFNKLTTVLPESTLAPDNELLANCCKIWGAFIEKQWSKAGEILENYSLEILTHEGSPLHFLYGCWLYMTEGPEIASLHFGSILDLTSPRSWALFSHFYNGKIVTQETQKIGTEQSWYNKAFLWEKKQLYRQMALFYHCNGEDEKALNYRRLVKDTIVDV